MFASLVLSMAAETKKEKKRKEEAYPWKAGASSGHITNLKQSILDFRNLWLAKSCFNKVGHLHVFKQSKRGWEPQFFYSYFVMS